MNLHSVQQQTWLPLLLGTVLPIANWALMSWALMSWLAVLMAVLTVILGLIAADAPRWMALVLTVWWLALALAAGYLERAGRCIDTYQAIWGPDMRHPGNQRPINGWRMRRPLANQATDRASP